jgi:branched-subunit amino acid transport protein
LDQVYLIVIGMAIVTYIPRLVPLLFLRSLKLPAKFQRFLSLIPYTVLGALIFPGVLTSTGNLFPAIVGTVTAFILSWMELNLIFVIIGSIFTTTLIQLI